MQVIVSAAFLFSTSGLLQIASRVDDEALIYYVTAAVIFVSSVFLYFGIKDVVAKDS